MLSTKKSSLTQSISLFLILLLCLTSVSLQSPTNNEKETIKQSIIYDSNSITSDLLLFDNYETITSQESTRITAFKNFSDFDSISITNSSNNDDKQYYSAYDVYYDHSAEIIRLTISIFDENETFISAKTMEAYPIYTQSQNVDALFDVDGKNLYLSEILNGTTENCFFFSLTMSLLAAKLVAAIIVTAKVAVAITAVVTIGCISYKVAEFTAQKRQERERLALKQETYKNPKIYYPATRQSGKLLISANPIGLITASKAIITGSDFWSPFDYTAKTLAIRASGSFVGPEVDSKKPGHYYHFHLKSRIGGHSFYGGPTGDVY